MLTVVIIIKSNGTSTANNGSTQPATTPKSGSDRNAILLGSYLAPTLCAFVVGVVAWW